MQDYISMYSAFSHHDWSALIDAILSWAPKQVFFSSLIDAVIHKKTENKWLALAIKINSVFALNLWQAENKAPVVHAQADEPIEAYGMGGIYGSEGQSNYNTITPGEVKSTLPNAQ